MHAGVMQSVQRESCRALRKVMVRTITKRISWHLAPTMKTTSGAEAGRPSLRAMPEPVPKSQQQFLSPPSPDDRALRGRVAGLMAQGTLKSTPSLPMSFPDALNDPKTAAQTENTRDSARGDTPHAHAMPTASEAHSFAKRRRKRRKRSNCVCPGPSTLGITAVLCHVRRVRVPQNLWRGIQFQVSRRQDSD